MILKKWILFLPLLAGLIYAAERVEIVSDGFEGDEKARISKFIGHVHMKKGGDELNASKVIVYFDTKRKPFKYEAIGKVSFIIYMKDRKSLYTGKAGKLIYRPATQTYELYDHVVLKEPKLDRTITGSKVIVEKIAGKASVSGQGNKPVRFIFKVEDDNASQNR